MFYLLDHQFVTSKFFNDRLWKVIEGSGQGLRHSGATADAAFYTLVERSWAARSEIQQAYNIKGYWRYRDDILIIGDRTTREKTRQFYFKMKEFGKYFALTCESCSSHSVDYLDITIEKCLATSTYTTKPYFKPSSLGIPLSTSSAHNPMVHHWPLARIKNFGRYSSSPKDAAIAKDIFIQRFIDHGAPTHFIAALQATCPEPKLSIGGISKLKAQQKFHQQQNKHWKPSLEWWLPLSYHPLWGKAKIQRRLQQFLSQSQSRAWWDRCFNDAGLLSATTQACFQPAFAYAGRIPTRQWDRGWNVCAIKSLPLPTVMVSDRQTTIVTTAWYHFHNEYNHNDKVKDGRMG